MLPTTVSSISVSRAPNASGCSRLTRTERACASAWVRSIPSWMRKRPSGLALATLSPAEPEPPRTWVWLVHALVLVPGCGLGGCGLAGCGLVGCGLVSCGLDRGAACACGGVSIEAVVDGAGCGGLDGGEAPPNQPAKGFDQPLLDGGGDVAASGEVPPADAVRVPRVALATAGATGPSPSATPAS